MAAFKPNPINYILGLDIGIASVGWAMVEIDEEENPIRLIDLGVRVFERAEVPKTGDSLAAARRLARSVRRLTRRRAHRLLRNATALVLRINSAREQTLLLHAAQQRGQGARI